MNKIIDTILNYVEPDDEITLSSHLKNDCGLTSFDMVCLIEELNTEYNKTVENSDIKNCHTVGDLCELFGVKEEAEV